MRRNRSVGTLPVTTTSADVPVSVRSARRALSVTSVPAAPSASVRRSSRALRVAGRYLPITSSPSSQMATGWPLTIDDTPSEAAISMAVSNWRSDGYESISVSTTTVRLGRRLST